VINVIAVWNAKSDENPDCCGEANGNNCWEISIMNTNTATIPFVAMMAKRKN
jgi:hypothetical protein